MKYSIKRFSEETVTLWHATPRENLSKIFREGLKVSDQKTGSIRESKDGLTKGMATGILYLSTDINNLVIDPRKPQFREKYILLEITVPRKIYNSWKKNSDPIHKFYKSKEDYIIGAAKAKFKRHPEKFPKFEEEIRKETGIKGGDLWKDVYPKTYEWKMINQEIKNFTEDKVLVIRNNIPPKYIKQIL